MHTITGACFLYSQGSSRKAHSLDYHEDESCKRLQNNHTYIPNYTAMYSRKLELCVYLMASELIQGSIWRILGFMLQDLTFSCQLLHKESKSQRKNSKRAIKDSPKLGYAYVVSFNRPPCKTMYVFVGTKMPIAFPSRNLLVWLIKWDSYPSVKIVNSHSTILTSNQEQNSILQCIK